MAEIFSFNEFRDKKFLKEEEKQFKKYLGSLKQEELQYEADYILEHMDNPSVSEDFLLKSALLMEELAQRVNSSQLSDRITKYSSQIREKMNGNVH